MPPRVQWLVGTRNDCAGLVALLERYPMRGRKRHEFRIWRSAVALWRSNLSGRAVAARGLRRALVEARRFRPPEASTVAIPPPDALRGYVHGLLCAEGSFTVARSKTVACVHMRQDERPLLGMLRDAIGVGTLRDQRAYPPSRPSSSWHVARLDEAVRLADFLDPSQLRGRKARELEIWLCAVAERRQARVTRRPARLDDLIADFRAARAYRPGTTPRSRGGSHRGMRRSVRPASRTGSRARSRVRPAARLAVRRSPRLSARGCWRRSGT